MSRARRQVVTQGTSEGKRSLTAAPRKSLGSALRGVLTALCALSCVNGGNTTIEPPSDGSEEPAASATAVSERDTSSMLERMLPDAMPSDLPPAPARSDGTGETVEPVLDQDAALSEPTAPAAAIPDAGAAPSSEAPESDGGIDNLPPEPVDAGQSPPNPAPPLTSQVGAPCVSALDCPATADFAMVCLPSGFNSPFGTEEEPGGPQGGYCTLPCRTLGECTAADELSACGVIDEQGDGFCLALCQPGASSAPGGNIKCGANRAQACVPTPDSPEVGLCVPTCTSDAECGSARFCDPGSGLCVAEAPTGGGIGSACSVEAEEADCASGMCIEFQDNAANIVGSNCSQYCTLGLTGGCGQELQSSAQRATACLIPVFENAASGDLGLCSELCDSSADCEQAASGWFCEPLPDGFDVAFGRAGHCRPPLAPVPADAGL